MMSTDEFWSRGGTTTLVRYSLIHFDNFIDLGIDRSFLIESHRAFVI